MEIVRDIENGRIRSWRGAENKCTSRAESVVISSNGTKRGSKQIQFARREAATRTHIRESGQKEASVGRRTSSPRASEMMHTRFKPSRPSRPSRPLASIDRSPQRHSADDRGRGWAASCTITEF
jgi:hypothetical protein